MNSKKVLIIFLIGLIFFGVLFRILSLNKDFSAEEPDFIKPAISMKNRGHPTLYISEQTPLYLALWHPPMYIFLMALIFKFSVTEIAARSINVFFSILTSVLIFFFCYRIIGKEKGKIIGLVSSAFFLINYYILSSSLLIDIDVLSCFFILGFVFFILMHYQTQKNIFLVPASLSLFFGVLNRYPIAVLAYVFVGIYSFFNKELRKNFKEYIYVGIFSFAGFIMTWGFYSTIIEPGNFFSFISHNTQLGKEQVSSLGIYLGSFILNISQFIRLFTLPATILMCWSFFHLINKKSKLIKILLFYVLPILLFFLILPRPAFGYPRYFMTIFPGVSILIGIFLYKNLQDLELDKRKKWIIISSFIISILILLILNPQSTIYESDGLIKATNLPDFGFNLLASLPLLFIFLFKQDRRQIAILILIALILSYCLFFGIKFVAHDTYTKEAGEYIKGRTDENDIILATKSVAYYAERRYYLNTNNKPKFDFSFEYLKEYVIQSLKDRKMSNEFFWPKGVYEGLYPPVPPESELKKVSYVVLYHPVNGEEPEEKIGDFYIYNLR